MNRTHQAKSPNPVDPLLETSPAVERKPLEEETFRQTIAIERKRTERSKAPFLLMLLEADSGRPDGQGADARQGRLALLSSSGTRI